MQGSTALIVAALNGHLAVVLLLAEVEDWNLEGVMVKAFESRDARRREQVIAYVRTGGNSVVSKVIDEGHSSRSAGHRGWTPWQREEHCFACNPAGRGPATLHCS